MSGWHFKKKLGFALLILVMSLTGCSSSSSGNNNGAYTEENMNHFESEKKAIPDITSVDISCSYADIEVIASDGFYLEYSFYYVTEEPKLSTEDGMFFFDDTKMNQGSYSISQKEQNYIKLYVPTTAKFENFSLSTSSGDISAGSFTTDKLSIEDDYGDVILTSTMINDGTIKLSSGSLRVEEVGAKNLELQNSYGDITLLNLNQGPYAKKDVKTSLNTTMSSGTFNGTNLSFHECHYVNSYGDVILNTVTADTIHTVLRSGDLVANDIKAHNMNIENSYGDVSMIVKGTEKDYNLNAYSNYGTVTIGSRKYEGNVMIDHQAEKDIEIKVSSGDISLNYK
ncbi:MAG: DUF4097 domain-containing protein [Lachnospiraceae bacterium]|nr:DUF4097 domain-containing protein [Lachnospiraceae bacterium]